MNLQYSGSANPCCMQDLSTTLFGTQTNTPHCTHRHTMTHLQHHWSIRNCNGFTVHTKLSAVIETYWSDYRKQRLHIFLPSFLSV